MWRAYLEAFLLLALSTRWSCSADRLHGLLRNVHARNRNVAVDERRPSNGIGDHEDLMANDLAEANENKAFWDDRLLTLQSMTSFPPSLAPVASPTSIIVNLPEYCQELEENDGFSAFTCSCEVYADGVVGLNCVNGCTVCNDSETSCGTSSDISNFTDSFVTGPDSSETFQYDGTGGIYGNVTIDYRGCDDETGCAECIMYVNASQCNSCAFCANGQGEAVDCENLVEGSSFSMCEGANAFVFPGVFQGFSYTLVASCPEPPPPPPPPPPANDNCTDAIVLQIGENITGTASGATPDSFPSCSMIENSVEGVWYKFLGNGSPIVVSTCLDTDALIPALTYVSVYQGSTCGQLECLPTYYYQALTCGGPRGGSSIAMESTINVPYYVHISNRFELGLSSRFSLSVSAHTAPMNDECSNAGEIVVDSSSVRGTINRSIGDDNMTTPCGATMDGGSGAAWYEVTPTKNATLRASTCSSGTVAMNTALTVLRGDCDDGQTCLSETVPFTSYENCPLGEGTIVDFEVVADGTNYSIVVWGPVIGDLGFFELDIRSLNPPDNDDCTAATGLVVDGPNVTGTFFDSTTSVDEQDLSCVFPFSGNAGGVWYSFTGTGGFIIAGSCSDFINHYITVYEGECGGSLRCVAPINGAAPMDCNGIGSRSLPIETVEGRTYYVLVSRILLEEGSFDMSIKTVTPPANDECTAAIEVVPDNETRIVGNTVDAIYDEASFFCPHGTSRSPALWYLVRGTGETMRADTCSFASNLFFDTVITIHEGPCGVTNSSCLASNDNACASQSQSSAVAWPTEPGVDYYIRVAGSNEFETGEFGLLVSAFEAAPNDVCSGAIELTTGVTVRTSMEGASEDAITDCSSDDSSIPGIWYYVDGLGSALAISTCDPTGNGAFSGYFKVFQGSSCSSGFECVPLAFGNDCSSSSFSASSVMFFAEVGQRYYILFQGFLEEGSDFNKNFTITVANFEPAINDVCEGAVRMDNSSLSIIGSTEDSFPDNRTCSQDFSPWDGSSPEGTTPGVWYTVKGTGRPMMASTCSSALTMDTSLNVFSGNCDQLACVAYGESSNDWCEETRFAASRVSFRTEVDQMYYVLVAGRFLQSGGNFGLTISDTDLPTNDLCTNATLIIPNNGTIVGSVVDITFSEPSGCTFFGSPGLWYRIDGTGSLLTASTCGDNATFDSVIEINEAMDGTCTTLSCVAFNDNACGSASEIEWFATSGKTYFIRVTAFSRDDRGQFQLSVTTP